MAAPMNKQHELGVTEPSYCKLKHFVDEAKIGRLKGCLEILSLCQQQHEKILFEFKLLQVMIYNRNGQLRKEKSIQLLKRVQACLKRFHMGTKLYKHVSDLCLDIKCAQTVVKGNVEACFIPARQTWMYTLFILQKYVELLKATGSYCISAFEHLSCQFSTGMLIPQMLLFMGTVSRIRVLSKSIQGKATKMYAEIFAELENIPRAPSKWENPFLPPSIQDEEDAINMAHLSRLSDSMLMASASAPRGVDSKLSKTESDLLPLVSSKEDEEDLGEPIAVQDLNVDENFNLRKRMMDCEDSGITSKKIKTNNLQESRNKKISKKKAKLERKRLFEENVLQEAPAASKGKKLKAMGEKVKRKSKKEQLERLLPSEGIEKEFKGKQVSISKKKEKKKKQSKFSKEKDGHLLKDRDSAKGYCGIEKSLNVKSNEMDLCDHKTKKNTKKKKEQRLQEKQILLEKNKHKQNVLKISKKIDNIEGKKRKVKKKKFKAV